MTLVINKVDGHGLSSKILPKKKRGAVLVIHYMTLVTTQSTLVIRHTLNSNTP